MEYNEKKKDQYQKKPMEYNEKKKDHCLPPFLQGGYL